MGVENDVLRQMTNPERLTPQIANCEEDPSFYLGILPGDYMYEETNRDFISTRKLLHNEMTGEVIDKEKRPIHRLTYFKTLQGARIHYNLHIKNMIPSTKSAHLFHFYEKLHLNDRN